MTANGKYDTDPECNDVECAYDFSVVMLAVVYIYIYTRVIQKVKAIFKLLGNRDREELVHCALLTMPVEEFCHLQCSAPPSVE